MSAEPTTRSAPALTGEQALRTALSSRARPERPGAISASLTFTWRGMLKIKHVPEQLLDVTLTPVMFTLMFTYLFGGAIAGSTGDYLQFLLPGILVITVVFTTVYSGVTMNTDMTKGVVDRFRSLPIWRPAPLVGPVLSDSARYLAAAAVALALGLVLGFEAEAGIGGVVAALAVLLAFAFGLSWVFTALGLVMRTPNAVMNVGFTVLFPLTFASNAFVERATMPDWLDTAVGFNPFTWLVTAERGLMAGTDSAGDVGLVLATAAVLTAIFAPLTMHLYRSKV